MHWFQCFFPGKCSQPNIHLIRRKKKPVCSGLSAPACWISISKPIWISPPSSPRRSMFAFPAPTIFVLQINPSESGTGGRPKRSHACLCFWNTSWASEFTAIGHQCICKLQICTCQRKLWKIMLTYGKRNLPRLITQDSKKFYLKLEICIPNLWDDGI